MKVFKALIKAGFSEDRAMTIVASQGTGLKQPLPHLAALQHYAQEIFAWGILLPI